MDTPDFTFDKPKQGSNLSVPATRCDTCDGDRLVLVSRRRPAGSVGMIELGNTPSETEMYEEYAPCPDCNADADTGFFRADGSKFRSPDPALVRARMRG